MTKKDYIKFAKMIAEQRNDAWRNLQDDSPTYTAGRLQATKEIAHNMAAIFAEDNPNFDRDRFLKTCGLS